ncbi:MAG: DUF4326 domain-containing protein [Rhodospirillaceae bacterium]
MPVMNGRTEREYLDEDAVTITRPSKWGNLFVLGRDGDRDTVIALYRGWLWDQIKSGEISLEELAELHSRQLVCICKPKPCHGDVLEAAAEWAFKQLETRSDASAG